MFGRRRSVAPDPDVVVDEAAAPAEELGSLIDQVEATALAVYRRHGLPGRHGQYARGPRAKTWTLLADSLTPEEKWARLESHPTTKGWRYGDLIRIGQESETAEVLVAAGVLAACRGLRMRIQTGRRPTYQDLADALRLGEAWRRMAEVEATASPAAPIRRRRKT